MTAALIAQFERTRMSPLICVARRRLHPDVASLADEAETLLDGPLHPGNVSAGVLSPAQLDNTIIVQSRRQFHQAEAHLDAGLQGCKILSLVSLSDFSTAPSAEPITSILLATLSGHWVWIDCAALLDEYRRAGPQDDLLRGSRQERNAALPRWLFAYLSRKDMVVLGYRPDYFARYQLLLPDGDLHACYVDIEVFFLQMLRDGVIAHLDNTIPASLPVMMRLAYGNPLHTMNFNRRRALFGPGPAFAKPNWLSRDTVSDLTSVDKDTQAARHRLFYGRLRVFLPHAIFVYLFWVDSLFTDFMHVPMQQPPVKILDVLGKYAKSLPKSLAPRRQLRVFHQEDHHADGEPATPPTDGQCVYLRPPSPEY